MFVDRGSVEVYVNGGKQFMSSYSYASKGPRAIRLVAESGSLTVTSLTQSGRHAARRYQAFTNRVSEIAFQLLGFPVQG